MSAHTSSSPRTTYTGAVRRRLLRCALVVTAGVAAALAWVIAVPVAGLRLDVVTGGQQQTVAVGACIVGGIVGGLMGWASLAVFERFTRSPRKIWTIVALVAMALSLTSPLSAATSASTAVVLALMHVLVGAIIIPALPPTRSGRFRLPGPGPESRGQR